MSDKTKKEIKAEKKAAKKEKKQAEKLSFKAMFHTRSMRAGGYSIASAAVIIVIVILVNALVGKISTAYTQFDTTSSGVYSISDSTKTNLKNLENEIDIYYICQSGSEVSYVTRLLDKFERYGGKKLRVERIDPDIDPAFLDKYSDAEISSGDILVVCGDKYKAVPFDDMVTYEAGSYEYYMYYAQQGQQTAVYWNGEVALLKAIDKVTNDKEYNVYCLGESLSDFSSFLENENITPTALDLEDAAAGVPDDAACVIISGLDGDLSDDEYKAIETYIKNGGKLYVDSEFSSTKKPNLDKILQYFGISFTDGTVNDKGRGHYNSYNGTTEDIFPVYAGEHAIIYPLLDASNYTYFTGSMGIITEEKTDINITPLLITSDSAYLPYDEDEGEEPEFNTFTIGAVAENSKSGAELVVYGDSDYTSSTVTAMAGANIDLFINSIGWLCDKENAISVHAKTITSSTSLDFSNSSTLPLMLAITALPALIVIIVGVVIWYKRRNS